jgi:hypothetical protein
MSLLTSLISYWKLDSGGLLVDSAGSNTLTNNGTVTTTTGKIAEGASLNGSTQYLSHADNASLSMGDIDFTISAWVKLTSKTANSGIVGKWQGANNYEYFLYYDHTADRYTFIRTSIGNFGGGNFSSVAADSFGNVATGQWHFVVIRHDATADKIYISVDGGTVDENAALNGAFDGAAPFLIGDSGDHDSPADAVIDEVGLWKRKLTDGEVTQLYGSGNGLAYPFSGATTGTLTLTAVSGSSVSLSFATNSGGASPYSNQLQRSAHGANTWSSIGSPVAGATATFTDSTVAANTDYDYRVAVTDSAPITVNSTSLRVLTRAGTTYYFATAGSDSNNGTSTSTPFQTISKANTLKMQAGDTFYFNKGDTFSGNLVLALVDGGMTPTALLPLLVDAYGSGAAPIISAADGTGITGHTLPYLTINALKIVGSGVTLNAGSPNTITTTNTGIGIYCKNLGSSDLSGLTVSNCDVSGFAGGCIIIGSVEAAGTNGYNGATITGNTVYQTASTGIDLSNYTSYTSVHTNCTISSNVVYNHYGDGVNNTGYGIVISATTGTIVSSNYVHDNGQAAGPLAVGAPVGIMGVGAVNCIIRGNVIVNQHRNGNAEDGEGIDLDGNGCTGNIVERNYVTGCEGEGIVCLDIGSATDSTTIRFNVVEKCLSAIRIKGATNTVIHNNTFYQTGSGTLLNNTTAGSGTKLYNNVLITGAGATLGTQTSGVTFHGNLYDCSTFSIVYNGNTRASLAAFRAGDSQETATGFQTTANLRDAGNGPASPTTATSVTAYDPATNSSHVVGTGLDISSLYSVNPGTLDFHGLTNDPGTGFAIGAVASALGFSATPSTIPKNHSGNITITLTGSGTSWVDGVTVFTPDHGTKVSQHVSSATSATLVITTDNSFTGTLTITESVTGTSTATVTVATATLAISPTSSLTDDSAFRIDFTGTNTVWTQEAAASLIGLSGGTLGTLTVDSDTAAHANLTAGMGTAITFTDASTGQTAALAIGAATKIYVSESPTARAAINIVKTFHVRGNGLTTATSTGHINADGSFAATHALNGTTYVSFALTMTDYVNSPYTVNFTASGLTTSANITLTVTQFPDVVSGGLPIGIGIAIGI